MEAVARVETLKRNNKNLRKALSLFEKRAHKPKIENSIVISDKVSDTETASLLKQMGSHRAPFQKAALPGQDRFSSPEGEVVLIPTVDLPASGREP